MDAPKAASPRRKRMSAQDRRAQIIAAARQVFVAQGLNGTRTRDIAAEAGINEALLYKHFASKEELFDAAVVEPLQDAVSRLTTTSTTPPAEHESSLDEMRERARLFIRDLALVMQDLAPLLGVMLFGGEEPASSHYRTSVDPLLKQIADVVRKNLGWWDHRSFDPDLVVRLIFGAVWFETASSRLESRTPDVDTIARELSTAVVLGLASEL